MFQRGNYRGIRRERGKGKKERNKNNSKQFYLRRVGSVYSPQAAINARIHAECIRKNAVACVFLFFFANCCRICACDLLVESSHYFRLGSIFITHLFVLSPNLLWHSPSCREEVSYYPRQGNISEISSVHIS